MREHLYNRHLPSQRHILPHSPSFASPHMQRACSHIVMDHLRIPAQNGRLCQVWEFQPWKGEKYVQCFLFLSSICCCCCIVSIDAVPCCRCDGVNRWGTEWRKTFRNSDPLSFVSQVKFRQKVCRDRFCMREGWGGGVGGGLGKRSRQLVWDFSGLGSWIISTTSGIGKRTSSGFGLYSSKQQHIPTHSGGYKIHTISIRDHWEKRAWQRHKTSVACQIWDASL